MNEEQTNYKVTDRRLFNADGTPREVPEEERPVAKPEPEATAVTEQPVAAAPIAAEPEAATAPDETNAELSAESSAESSVENEQDAAEIEDPAGFANFLMSIASNAASALGMMEHPVTRKREVDLELGKHWIDVLGMLENKTRGNLLPQEQQILEGLLADLRMQYVSLMNATPKARTFTSQDITGG
ncbi:MAG TPA: DUF1844 domain-containing protein [Pyrinomonadaceae bacterium]|nr:DUF1844 domain-containing protein [Pyrinomonadaceae bacterium]